MERTACSATAYGLFDVTRLEAMLLHAHGARLFGQTTGAAAMVRAPPRQLSHPDSIPNRCRRTIKGTAKTRANRPGDDDDGA